MPADETSSGGRSGRRPRLALAGVICALAIAAVVSGCGGSDSSTTTAKLPPVQTRHKGPESMFTAATVAMFTPAVVAQLKAMGFDRVHIYMHWADIAPDDPAKTKPAFDASDPAGYPAASWAPYDAAIRLLTANHLDVDLDLVAPPPRWAGGNGAPHPARQTWWEPDAADYGQFVHATAVRYDGHYTPSGASAPLPRVSFWSIWNEPDLGNQLAPEILHGVEVAPRLYRGLVDAAWNAFQATGHGKDTILLGELAPAGIHSGTVGLFNEMTPLQFLRGLYCVDSNYQPLRGAAATQVDCPATAADSSKFAGQNPGLFRASGMAIHPYPQGLPPDEPTPNEPDYAELAALPHVETILDRLQRIYGSNTKFPIWSTEFGYQTTPPDKGYGTVSPETAAYYLNWSEYLTWRDPREMSYDQYLLTDPDEPFFDSGLETATGTPKPGYGAFEMPLFLPVTAAAKGHPLVVWGAVRPAHNVAVATHKRQAVQIQYSAGAGRPYRTVQTVPLTGSHGYFEVRSTFPGSGHVRLAWTPPGQAAQYSRVVDITLR